MEANTSKVTLSRRFGQVLVNQPDAAPWAQTTWGEAARVLVSPLHEGQELCVMDYRAPAHFGPPRHAHFRDDEILRLVSGRIVVWSLDGCNVAGPGDVVLLPKGVAHTWRSLEAEVHMEVTTTPGEFETFFRRLAALGGHLGANRHLEHGGGRHRRREHRPAAHRRGSADDLASAPTAGLEAASCQISGQGALTKTMHPKKLFARGLLALSIALFLRPQRLDAQIVDNSRPAESAPLELTRFDRQIIDAHRQKYPMSCIPSGTEMVLELLSREPSSYYEQQDAWKQRHFVSFKHYDGQTIAGVTFHQRFALRRNGRFPLDKLFATIQGELRAGRFVEISLTAGRGWHIWVIYDQTADGEFLAVSKAGARTIEQRHVKAVVTRMQGTDILTYDLHAAGPRRGTTLTKVRSSVSLTCERFWVKFV